MDAYHNPLNNHMEELLACDILLPYLDAASIAVIQCTSRTVRNLISTACHQSPKLAKTLLMDTITSSSMPPAPRSSSAHTVARLLSFNTDHLLEELTPDLLKVPNMPADISNQLLQHGFAPKLSDLADAAAQGIEVQAWQLGLEYQWILDALRAQDADDRPFLHQLVQRAPDIHQTVQVLQVTIGVATAIATEPGNSSTIRCGALLSSALDMLFESHQQHRQEVQSVAALLDTALLHSCEGAISQLIRAMPLSLAVQVLTCERLASVLTLAIQLQLHGVLEYLLQHVPAVQELSIWSLVKILEMAAEFPVPIEMLVFLPLGKLAAASTAVSDVLLASITYGNSYMLGGLLDVFQPPTVPVDMQLFQVLISTSMQPGLGGNVAAVECLMRWCHQRARYLLATAAVGADDVASLFGVAALFWVPMNFRFGITLAPSFSDWESLIDSLYALVEHATLPYEQVMHVLQHNLDAAAALLWGVLVHNSLAPYAPYTSLIKYLCNVQRLAGQTFRAEQLYHLMIWATVLTDEPEHMCSSMIEDIIAQSFADALSTAAELTHVLCALLSVEQADHINAACTERLFRCVQPQLKSQLSSDQAMRLLHVAVGSGYLPLVDCVLKQVPAVRELQAHDVDTLLAACRSSTSSRCELKLRQFWVHYD